MFFAMSAATVPNDNPKKQLRSALFFGLPFKQFWENVSRNDDSPLEFPEVLKITRIALLILVVSSICERQFYAYNRMHTAERANLNVTAIRSAFAINSNGPLSISDFKPEGICRLWMGLIASDRGGPMITCPRRRSLAAMVRKVMADAQTRYEETGSLPHPLV